MPNRDEELNNLRLYDRRTVHRNIKRGLVTAKDYEKHLKSLPDAADRIAPPEERHERSERPRPAPARANDGVSGLAGAPAAVDTVAPGPRAANVLRGPGFAADDLPGQPVDPAVALRGLGDDDDSE